MFEWVSEIQATVERGVVALQPEVLDSETAAQLVERFAHIERTAAAGKALCAGRVADSGRGARRAIVPQLSGWRGPPGPR